ncbi:hypothetical protein [Devosia naphthalenivorans]|uniref:hypothetical protein n=1 Tax=Devosia naphthalenivorans TaxID=2082392 RepID=UPI000D3536C3|nr:hypothetical protein [Devosia naphthalenivorans]
MHNETTTAELTLRQIASCAAALPYANASNDQMERVFEKFRSFARRAIIEPYSGNGQGKTAVYTEEMGCAGVLLFELYEIGMDYSELRRLRQTFVPTRMKSAIAAIRLGHTVSFEVLHHLSPVSGEAGFGGLFQINGQPDTAHAANTATEPILQGFVMRWRMVMNADLLLKPILKMAD